MQSAFAQGEFRYYLLGPNQSVVGVGNADGSVIERLDYTSTGDWVSGGEAPPGYYHDADADFDIDLADVASFAACFDPAGGQASPACLAAHDYDSAGVSDGNVDLDDFTALTGCYEGPYVTPSQDCARPSWGRSLPESGTYALHGRPVDVLSDGLVLVNYRARTYLPQHARFLQRDPTGYSDGNNLYEAFASNPLSRLDPFGTSTAASYALQLASAFSKLGQYERRYPEWYLYAHDHGALWRYYIEADLLRHQPRFLHLELGVADFEEDTVAVGVGWSEADVQELNDFVEAQAEHWLQTGDPGLPVALSGYPTIGQEEFLSGCDAASMCLGFIPLVPFDYIADCSSMKLRAYRGELADDPFSSWFYAHPFAHLGLRVLPDALPVVGELSSGATGLRFPKMRVSSGSIRSRLNWRSYRVTVAPNTLGTNAGNVRLRYVGSGAGKGVRRDVLGRFASGTGGHSANAARGVAAHRNYRSALGGDYQFEVKLPSGRRADAVSFENRIVRELKPDNPRAIRHGSRQLERYRQELQREFGGTWTSFLDTYQP